MSYALSFRTQVRFKGYVYSLKFACLTVMLHVLLCVVAFISSQLYILKENIWIGLSDRFWNNHFWWSNNDQVQFTNWIEGEPDLRQSVSVKSGCLSVVFMYLVTF